VNITFAVLFVGFRIHRLFVVRQWPQGIQARRKQRKRTAKSP
jgi:hypothetical protein